MTSRYSTQELVPPKPGLAVRVANRLYTLLPIKSKIRVSALLLKLELGGSEKCEPQQGRSFSVAGKDDLDYIIAHPEAVSRKVYLNRIRNGDICVCIKRDGELVCYNWVRFTSCCAHCGRRSGFRFIPLQPSQAFTYDFYTYEKYRKQGLGKLLKSCLFHELRSRGINEVLSVVEPGNRISLTIHLGLGYELVAVVTGYGFFGWTNTFMASQRQVSTMRRWIGKISDSVNTA